MPASQTRRALRTLTRPEKSLLEHIRFRSADAENHPTYIALERTPQGPIWRMWVWTLMGWYSRHAQFDKRASSITKLEQDGFVRTQIVTDQPEKITGLEVRTIELTQDARDHIG